MKRLAIAALAATMFTGIFVTGCETSHTESDRPTLGGQKHDETTTYKNPVTGDTTTEHKSNTSGG